jgi:hypothetical protein
MSYPLLLPPLLVIKTIPFHVWHLDSGYKVQCHTNSRRDRNASLYERIVSTYACVERGISLERNVPRLLSRPVSSVEISLCQRMGMV